MPELRTQHVIFTRVERAYSPRNSSGYQIVYHSPMPEKVVTQIEKQLQCFQTGAQKIDRYQFFWTENNQAVLAKSVPLHQPDPDVIDRAQRDAFLAHALIVSREEFALVRNNPFAVFEAAEREGIFAEDAEQLVGYLQEKAPEEKLFTPMRRPDQVSYLLDDWAEEELFKLYQLGVQASALSRQGQSLLLIAEDQGAIFELLSLLFALLPSSTYRAACTFDTCVDSCYPAAGTFWLAGGSREKNNPGFIPIHLIEQKLKLKEGGADLRDPKVLASSARWKRHLPGDYTCCDESNKMDEFKVIRLEARGVQRAWQIQSSNQKIFTRRNLSKSLTRVA
jgi:hypothetical protein